jgi:5-methylcytosine-specific restriction endonuclease McrA
MKRSLLARKTPLQSHVSMKHRPMKKHRSKRPRSRDFSLSVRQIVKGRSNGICELCNMRPIAHLHHAIFRSQLGTGELTNAIGLCTVCHEAAHKHRTIRELCVDKARELVERR